MTKVFIVTKKENGAKYAYTSLAAVFLVHTKDELGVSKPTLDRFDFDTSKYENRNVIIEKFLALSTVEARMI